VIYLILDTNIWLYLANGFDPISSKNHDDLHFKLLEELKALKEKGDVQILINDIILEEWRRNKEHCKQKVNKLKNKLRNPESAFTEIRKYTKTEIEPLIEEYTNGLKDDIKENLLHIEKVQSFLLKECVNIGISDEVKLQIFDLSTHNLAPFHNDKNNIADAAILFSSVKYLNDTVKDPDANVIFVSNNTRDFTDGKDKDKFHPDIRSKFGKNKIEYRHILPRALHLSKEIFIELEEYYKHQQWLESVSFKCETPWCNSSKHESWGYLSETIDVVYASEYYLDPNQLSLFTLSPLVKPIKEISYGHCVICETPHYICPSCGELGYNDEYDQQFNCKHCKTALHFDYATSRNTKMVIGEAPWNG
jgi:PIN domain